MRKVLFTCILSTLAIGLFAQSAPISLKYTRSERMASVKNMKPVHFVPTNLRTTGVPVNSTPTFYAKSGERASTEIGTSTYDLQTNGAGMDRVRAYADGSVDAIWTGSTALDMSWGDRGMFYNHYDGTTWGANPTTRSESQRVGFGGLLTVMDHEVIVSHDGTHIRVYGNSAIGSSSFSELSGSNILTGLWPRSYCPAGTDNIYVLSLTQSTDSVLTFSRSSDGGNSWDVANYQLPYLDVANCFPSAGSGDSYQIGVYGSTVYVLYGTSWTDLVLLKSTSNGDPGTWTSQTLISTGLCNYSGQLGQISDINGDGVADTIETTDGFHEMMIDDDGVVHVWSGYYILIDSDPTTAGWSYYPSANGLWYWNSTMATMGYINLLIDWDGDGDPFYGIGGDLGMYDGVTFTSFPASAYDPSDGRIYVTYAMPVENTDYEGAGSTSTTAQSFRDLFGVYSDDNGATWSEPINITYTAHSYQENVFDFAYDRIVGGKMHEIWMNDADPGTSLDASNPDPVGVNNILYSGWTSDRFNPYDPTADFDYSAATDGSGQVIFSNLSADADVFAWDFGDGLNSASENPVHTYGATGDYNVCLTSTNHYGNDLKCQSVSVVVTSIEDVLLNDALNMYPTPANNDLNIDVKGNLGAINVTVYNAIGQQVLASAGMSGSNIQLNVANLAQGNYMVKVQSDKGLVTRQISVAH